MRRTSHAGMRTLRPIRTTAIFREAMAARPQASDIPVASQNSESLSSVFSSSGGRNFSIGFDTSPSRSVALSSTSKRYDLGSGRAHPANFRSLFQLGSFSAFHTYRVEKL